MEALIAEAKPVDRLAIRVLVATGMRAGELYALTWADVDIAGSRLRITRGKTKAARRWVAIPEETLQLVLEQTPPDDRTVDRRVFHGNPDSLGHRLTTACKNAGIAHYSPHNFRHLYISVMHAKGVPMRNITAQVGHARASVTWDTYSHVLLDPAHLE